jgi:thiamine biosynthesis lipoprotein
MDPVTLALNAMHTRFELVLHGADGIHLRAAGEEALHEITRIEALLSAFRPSSEIAQVNARAGREPVQVSPEVFRLLEQARALWAWTDGAFDITIGPLMRCWGFWGAGGAPADRRAVQAARASAGLNHLHLDPEHRTVRFGRPGMTLDLGAIGKGYAVDQAVECLRESGVSSALLHGGTSTAYALGTPPGGTEWTVAIDVPRAIRCAQALSLPAVGIRDQAVSVSSVAEKSFTVEGRTYGHVIDPRTGEPVTCAMLAVVALPSATATDALSTALMVLGVGGLKSLGSRWVDLRGVVVEPDGSVHAVGLPFGDRRFEG